MNIKILREFIQLCEALEIEPTVNGLKAYKKIKNNLN